MADTAHGDLDKMANRVAKIGEDVATKARSALETASSVAAQTKSKIEDAGKKTWDVGQQIGSQAKDIANEVSNQGGRAVRSIRKEVQSQPLMWLCAAGAIGYFLGYVARHR